jgi:hypothetical protein
VAAQPGLRKRKYLCAGAGRAALGAVGTGVRLNGFHQLWNAVAFRGDQLEYRGLGLGAKIPHRLVGALAVGLVHHDDVRDLEQTRLGGLNCISRTGIEDDDGRIGDRGDLDLGLPDADRLQHDQVVGQGGE